MPSDDVTKKHEMKSLGDRSFKRVLKEAGLVIAARKESEHVPEEEDCSVETVLVTQRRSSGVHVH